MTILLYSPDLLSLSSLTGAAKQSGHALEAVNSLKKLSDRIVQGDVNLIVADLANPQCNIQAIADAAQAAEKGPPRIIAYGPHVHTDRLDAASQAGCDAILTRGQFFRSPAEHFAQFLKDA